MQKYMLTKLSPNAVNITIITITWSNHHFFRQVTSRYTASAWRPMLPVVMDYAGNFDDYLVRSKKAASYLGLLNHSRTCKGACGQSTCRHTYRLLQHTDECKPNGNYRCEIKGCCTTKKLLAHVSECNAKALRLGDKKKLCLVCTLASKSVSAISGDEQFCSESLESPLRRNGSNPDQVIYRNRINSFRPLSRSQTMVDNSETIKENIEQDKLQAVYCAPFVPSRADQIQNITLNPSSSSSSRLNEFIVPTMIPKRFRSNTLQHVQHVAVSSNIDNVYVNRKREINDNAIDFPKEKWLCVDNISRKIIVGQL